MRHVWFWFILLALPLSTLADTGWRDYVNLRFGFKMSYPAELVASAEPENGDGREYHTKNKEFSVTAYGHYLVDATLNSLWEDDLKEFGRHITYKRKAANWYVVSGVKDGTEFYRKVHTKGDNCAVLHFTYSQVKAREYDPWVEKIVKSFKPFLKIHYEDAK
ncbi:conserved hypothetical protein [Chthoniobacter flavus Ellin428]|uniref:Uncharacterized protein n=1 Tax=Chthoniobacter flavus Ellin428 TaxID=497964 RepID=B4D5Y3_9BACT|nr:hypothetical protein [Chthoniobacter flavus]EDY18186.1 conserved hypothetical protein [Chthoniobacter flavus Ellin428]